MRSRPLVMRRCENMRILEEFWYGNIDPHEQSFDKQSRLGKILILLTQNESKLLERLNAEWIWRSEMNILSVPQVFIVAAIFMLRKKKSSRSIRTVITKSLKSLNAKRTARRKVNRESIRRVRRNGSNGEIGAIYGQDTQERYRRAAPNKR